MNLLMIPFHDWKKSVREGFRTRDGHFLQNFSQHSAIRKLLVINRPISWAEIGLLRRNWRVQQGTVLEMGQGFCLTQMNEKTFVLDIVIPEVVQPLLQRRHWIPRTFGSARVLRAVQRALERLGIADDYGMFVSAPLFVPLIQQLTPRYFALDAQDNLLKHSLYRDVPLLTEYYQYCLDNAQLLTTNSHETQQWFAKQRPDTIWIPNGVDPQVFNAMTPHPMPSDLATIPRPVVGYAGKMQEMVDVDLLIQAALAMPTIHFVFIGQILDKAWVDRLWKLPNVHYLGDKHYSLLPAYLAGFDICTIPYNLVRQHNVDPIKFYEYIAMGKPVVTTAVGNVGAFADFPQVHVSHTADQFIAALREEVALLTRPNSRTFKKLPRENYWDFKVDQIVNGLEAVAATRDGRYSVGQATL